MAGFPAVPDGHSSADEGDGEKKKDNENMTKRRTSGSMLVRLFVDVLSNLKLGNGSRIGVIKLYDAYHRIPSD